MRPWLRRMKVNEPYLFNFTHVFASTNILLSSNLQKIMPSGAIFLREEFDSFLDTVKDILPLSTTQWESVVETHSARYPDKGQTVDGLKRKFKELHIKRNPTSDPHCPPAVRRAKQLRNAIIQRMNIVSAALVLIIHK